MSDATMNETDILSRMDDSKITKQHWKIMFISGMGFFTDAYDLFIIGVVISILEGRVASIPLGGGPRHIDGAVWLRPSGPSFSAASPTCWAANAFTVMRSWSSPLGAIASAFSPDIWWLIGFRIILGIGIGGDYPVSATLDERVFRQEEPRHDGVAGLRDAGCRPHRRTASGSGLSGFRLVERPGVAPPAGVRRHTGAGCVPDAATYGGKPALSPGHRSTSMTPTRRPATCSVKATASVSGRQGGQAKPPSLKALWR
jgi:hypothetical protein